MCLSILRRCGPGNRDHHPNDQDLSLGLQRTRELGIVSVQRTNLAPLSKWGAELDLELDNHQGGGVPFLR